MILTIFDFGLGEYRPATQEDIDNMVKLIVATQCRPTPVPPPANLAKFDFRLAVFPNPMRNDGMFVAELKDIQPYPNTTSYPATPDTPWVIRSQITPAFAFEIVRRWNLVGDKEL